MKKLIEATVICICLSESAEATLLAHNGMVYDTEQNLTWVQETSAHGSIPMPSFDAGAWYAGAMTRGSAEDYVQNLNINGVTGWRLPKVITQFNQATCPSSNAGSDCGYNVNILHSELAYLFYELGNTSLVDSNGGIRPENLLPYGIPNSLQHTNPFTITNNILIFPNGTADHYGSFWLNAIDANSMSKFDYMIFDTNRGQQGWAGSNSGAISLVWAVQSGNVTGLSIPEPSTVTLLFAGFLGFGSQRFKAKIDHSAV